MLYIDKVSLQYGYDYVWYGRRLWWNSFHTRYSYMVYSIMPTNMNVKGALMRETFTTYCTLIKFLSTYSSMDTKMSVMVAVCGRILAMHFTVERFSSTMGISRLVNVGLQEVTLPTYCTFKRRLSDMEAVKVWLLFLCLTSVSHTMPMAGFLVMTWMWICGEFTNISSH